ncbi:hypothetical protein WMF20_12870 [Sorangium sp. So ce834]|uniref:hypothetical protein n=1 Tax=Sorangium sp. So ce834 TaxID=3133321 RepID=UPI003F606D3D
MKNWYVIVLGLGCNGCMLLPGDGDTVGSTAERVTFMGFTLAGGQRVVVEALRSGEVFEVGSDLSDMEPLHYDDYELHRWSLRAQIPSRAWNARGLSGNFAKVRARVIGVGIDGADVDASSFLPNWEACLTAHPDVNGFVASCKSPHAPFAFVYTSDFPSQADFRIFSIHHAGRLEVDVINGGRTGFVTRLECHTLGAHVSASFSELFEPGEWRTLTVGIVPTPGSDLVCTVTGTNLDGTPEANTANNTRTQRF